MHKRDVLVDLQEWLGYERVYTVNPIGRSCGLAMFWKKNVELVFQFVDKNLVDFHVQFGSLSYFVYGVYGAPAVADRSKVWERLMRTCINRKDSWWMLGDFNEILHNGEKIGGPRRSEFTFLPFADMVRVCEMSELPYVGNIFTWGGMRSKMDRCFGNKEWFRMFHASNQSFLAKRGLDHRPALVKLLSSSDSHRGDFRFDKIFFNKPNVKEAIISAWLVGSSYVEVSVSKRIRGCRRALSKWKKANPLNLMDKIIQLQVSLEMEQASYYPSLSEVTFLKRSLVEAYKEEESFWSQKSRERWLKDGDLNTKFFHASVKANRSRKRIEVLKDVNRNSQRSEASKGEVVTAYFSNLW